jgi:hypothetical protein
MNKYQAPCGIAATAAFLSLPTLVDMYFAITVLGDDLSLIFMGMFLLSFFFNHVFALNCILVETR